MSFDLICGYPCLVLSNEYLTRKISYTHSRMGVVPFRKKKPDFRKFIDRKPPCKKDNTGVSKFFNLIKTRGQCIWMRA